VLRCGNRTRLRVDRQLKEAMVKGLPMSPRRSWGLDEKTAMCCTGSARALLEQAAEQPSQ
jgi:hypothetical protein